MNLILFNKYDYSFWAKRDPDIDNSPIPTGTFISSDKLGKPHCECESGEHDIVFLTKTHEGRDNFDYYEQWHYHCRTCGTEDLHELVIHFYWKPFRLLKNSHKHKAITTPHYQEFLSFCLHPWPGMNEGNAF